MILEYKFKMETIKFALRSLYNDHEVEFLHELKQLNNHYICYKYYNKHGVNINIVSITGDQICKIFIDEKTKRIETLYDEILNKGLYVLIFSDHREYYIDDEFHSQAYTHEVARIINKNNKVILDDEAYPNLYAFIHNVETLTLIDKSEIFCILQLC